MSKLIEAHKLIAQGHALLAEYHAEIPGDAHAPKKEKKQKAAEPAPPAVTATPETTAAVVPPETTRAAANPATTPAQTSEAKRDAIRDRFRDFIKSSADNTSKAKNLLAQYGVAKFGEITDDKLDAFAASLQAVASPAASDTMI